MMINKVTIRKNTIDFDGIIIHRNNISGISYSKGLVKGSLYIWLMRSTGYNGISMFHIDCDNYKKVIDWFDGDGDAEVESYQQKSTGNVDSSGFPNVAALTTMGLY